MVYHRRRTVGVFAGNSFFFEVHNGYTREVFLNGEEFEGKLLELKNWFFGVIGGTIVGFHALMVMLSEHAFEKKEFWAYRAMWLGLLSWFAIDSGISIYYNALHNVVMINLVALVLIGIPLVMTRKAFRNGGNNG